MSVSAITVAMTAVQKVAAKHKSNENAPGDYGADRHVEKDNRQQRHKQTNARNPDGG
ncbi:MAG: hypothetical protein IT320_00110 [Anaerolineae bacterium]|nr:hypothetical protein [Anaerolineae bacterium]